MHDMRSMLVWSHGDAHAHRLIDCECKAACSVPKATCISIFVVHVHFTIMFDHDKHTHTCGQSMSQSQHVVHLHKSMYLPCDRRGGGGTTAHLGVMSCHASAFAEGWCCT